MDKIKKRYLITGIVIAIAVLFCLTFFVKNGSVKYITKEVTKDTMFKKGDVVIIYGLTNDIKEAFINSVGKVKKLEELDRSNQINSKRKIRSIL